MGNVHPDDPVRGQRVDDQGRCVHYDGPTDVVCHRFPDTGWTFWACHKCFHHAEGRPRRLWEAKEATELAVQCGVCRSILSIAYYRERQEAGDHSCPHCHAAWNPKCVGHRGHYFAF